MTEILTVRQKLEEYIKKSGLYKTVFADRCGLSLQRLWQIIYKEGKPSKKTAKNIERETGGEIKAEELRK